MSTLAEILHLIDARVAHLGSQLTEATRIGDIASVARIESDIAETTATRTAIAALIEE